MIGRRFWLLAVAVVLAACGPGAVSGEAGPAEQPADGVGSLGASPGDGSAPGNPSAGPGAALADAGARADADRAGAGPGLSPGLASDSRPVAIRIPAIGVDAELVGVGLAENGAMEVPDFGLAGWYTEGPPPGAVGPAVIVAHVDSSDGPDVFYRLRDLEPGDAIEVRLDDGSTAAFNVEDVAEYPKDELPGDRIWAPSGRPRLTLITCGGTFDRSVGHYTHNLIVFAAGATARSSS